MKAFGRALRRLRKRAGIAQEELALTAGIDRAYVSGLERGQHNPSLEMIYRFLPLLGITFPEFAIEIERERKQRRKNST